MTALDPADEHALRESLGRMKLLRDDEHASLTPLTGGVSSLIVRVDTGSRTLCLKRALPQLKVAAFWAAPVERNRAEVAWMKVAGRIVPGLVPEILGDDPHGNVFAMAYLDPADHPVWKALLLAGQVDTHTAADVGRRLAAIHSATAGDAGCAASFATDASFFALRLEPYFVAAASRNPDCAEALSRLVETTGRTKKSLVHGDISPKNILVSPRGPVFLDAECAWYGDPAFDLAFCLNHLLLKSIARPAHTAALLRSFEALAASHLARIDWEPVADFEQRCAGLLAGLLLARIDGKSPVEYITSDVDRERVRRVAVPLLRTPVDRLADVLRRWDSSR